MTTQSHPTGDRTQILIWVAIGIIVLGVVYYAL